MYKNLKVLAVAMAREGSKGVAAKNIRDLAGLPLIGWVIRAAKKAAHIDRVILSTDGEEIARVGKTIGVEVPFMRPKELAEDHTPDAPVLEHALSWLKEHEQYEPDIVVHLRPTGPLVTPRELDEAIELLATHPEMDSVRSMQKPGKPPYKMWKPSPDGQRMVPFMEGMPIPEDLKGRFKDWHTAPRQILPPVYETTADIGVVWARVIKNQHSVIGEKVLGYILTRPTADIDNLDDFKIAALWLSERKKSDSDS